MIHLESLFHSIFSFFTQPAESALLFSSGTFWLLFLVFLSIYALLYQREKSMMLYVIAFSLFFYYKTNGVFTLLLFLTALLGWGLAKKMSTTQNQRKKKGLLTVSLVLTAGILAYFKYAGFLVHTFNDLFQTNFSIGTIFLPVGISFYTFQSISYLVDVYKGKVEARASLVSYLFYLSFFPLLLAGPIVRAPHFFPQLKNRYRVNSKMLYLGLWLILMGLIKKAILADYIAQFTNLALDSPEQYGGFEVFMGIIGYSMQIYLDFAGYSDMAIGLGALLGFDLGENFRSPYRATNMTEFWHRWHISLSTWLRDYIYIPLGGNRKGNFRKYINNMVTMLIGGLWHGASWMFVGWGALHGAGLIVHKLSQPILKRLPQNNVTTVTLWGFNYSFILLTWVFFRCTSWEIGSAVLSRIFTAFDWAYAPLFLQVRLGWCIALVIALVGSIGISQKRYEWMRDLFIRAPWWVKLISFTLVVQCVVQLQSSNVQPFIYSQF
jgi:D-alanyl-lipoteichoic acid acyltransferase DltB (MBOAT superfamily)